jgi:hypothetical protein
MIIFVFYNLNKTEMFLKLLIVSIVFLLIAFAGLGIRMLLRPGGKFPETHISRNKEMQKRGIGCAQDTDIGCIPSDDSQVCSVCGQNIRLPATGDR